MTKEARPNHKDHKRHPVVGQASSLFIDSLVARFNSKNSNAVGYFVCDSNPMFGSNALASLIRLDLDHNMNDFQSGLGSERPKDRSAGLVFGAFPFGNVSGNLQGVDTSIVGMLDSLRFIANDGVGIFVLRDFYSSFTRSHTEQLLADKGFSVRAVINSPQGFLMPMIAARSLIVVVSQAPEGKVFLLDSKNMSNALLGLDNYFEEQDTNDLASGIWLYLNEFSGFEAWHLTEELSSIGGDYTTYTVHPLSNIATGFFRCRNEESFTQAKHAIYIPLTGAGQVMEDLSETTLKHHNYAQVILNDSLVTAEFVTNFFNSKYGKALLKLEREQSGSIVPRISLQSIRNLRVSIPPIEIQKEICSTMGKLMQLRRLVADIEENISISPISSMDSVHQIDFSLSIFGQFTFEDRLLDRIRNGESKVTEFKQTLRMDVENKSVQKYIEESAIKTIAAFLNSDGGELLIGVKDNGEIIGIKEEIDTLFKGNSDKYLLHFKNLLKVQIGEQFYPLIDQRIFELRGKKVLYVNCKKSPTEVFVNGLDFYVRTNPATDLLRGQKLLAYIRQRFETAEES